MRAISNDDILGAYINGNGCIADTRWGCVLTVCDEGVTVYARCCNITDNGSSLTTYTSAVSGTDDDDLATISCSDTEKLIGCTGYMVDYSGGKAYDGSMMGTEYGTNGQTNTCIAKNGWQGNGVYAAARCYNTSTITDEYELDCVAVWGNEGHISTVTCPFDEYSDYFMTSCNGYSQWSDLLAFYIDDNICTVTFGGDNEEYYAIANAMWYVSKCIVFDLALCLIHRFCT